MSEQTPQSSSEWMSLHDKLAKDLEEAHKSKMVVDDELGKVRRQLIDLSATRTDLIKRKFDLEQVWGKAKENIRRIATAKSSAKDHYFMLSKEGR